MFDHIRFMSHKIHGQSMSGRKWLLKIWNFVSRFVSTKGTIWSSLLVPCVARFCFYCTERRTLGITRSLGRSHCWRVVTAVVLSSPYSHHLKRFQNLSGVLLWLCWCSTMCWVSWVLLRHQFSHESYVVTIIANNKYSSVNLASELQVLAGEIMRRPQGEYDENQHQHRHYKY